MTLTPEHIAQGWKVHDGSDVCPIKDDLTVHQVMFRDGQKTSSGTDATKWNWRQSSGYRIIAYRIIEAHGADAEPARPTPFPASYDDLVFDPITGWSQTIIVDGKRPEWLRDDDWCIAGVQWNQFAGMDWGNELAIRVRRRESKRETRRLAIQIGVGFLDIGTIDLIDGKPDLSTLKIAEDAL